LGCELSQECNDTFLVVRVKTGRGLIGHDQWYVCNRSHRDQHPLPLTTGKLVRKALHNTRHIDYSCPTETLSCDMYVAGFYELSTNDHGRVEGVEWVLGDNLNECLPYYSQLNVGCSDDFLACHPDRSAHDR